VRIGECDGPAWSRDGRRIACVAGQNIVVIDVASKREVEQVRFHGWPMPPGAARVESLPEVVEWAPDGTALLVATLGKNSNSSQPQSDFFVLGLSAKTWTAAGSGNDASWAPDGKAIVFSTPQELGSLGTGGHEVWTAHVAMFDLGARRQTLVTSGTANDIQPAACGR
jgi:Tol biopolymer transport system component